MLTRVLGNGAVLAYPSASSGQASENPAGFSVWYVIAEVCTKHATNHSRDRYMPAE